MISGKKSSTIESGAIILGTKKSIGINEYLIKP